MKGTNIKFVLTFNDSKKQMNNQANSQRSNNGNNF